jgi:hypothetical protein
MTQGVRKASMPTSNSGGSMELSAWIVALSPFAPSEDASAHEGCLYRQQFRQMIAGLVVMLDGTPLALLDNRSNERGTLRVQLERHT